MGIGLKVQLLVDGAKAPTVAHPGEDLGYDLYALESLTLAAGVQEKVRTGIAVEARHPATGEPLGLLVRDRSSMASRGLVVSAGVIDAGYRGEILVLIRNADSELLSIAAGEKIAQMLPLPVLTGEVVVQQKLELSSRGEKGFGSSGRQ
jgi:dUTP pyrophosphatase